MNKKTLIYLPIIIAISITIGIWLGKSFFTNPFESLLNQNYFTSNNLTFPSSEKLQSILYYIENEYVDTINHDSLIDKAITALLQQLDPHSIYIPPSEFEEMNEPLEGEFDGIGVEFSIQKDTIVVMNTIIGGPSEKIGLMAGDRIIKVNDSIVAGVGITNNQVMKLLKGPKGTKVKVHIKRNKIKNLLTFTITRDKIPMYSIDAYMMLSQELGYIKIARFAKTTPEEFHNALLKLNEKGMKQLIVDVRGNGGGYMDAAISIADEFLKKDELIVYTEGKSQPKHDYNATEFGIAEDVKLAVLIDEWSASASEIFAGAIQDNDRGIIVGRKSFGKGLVQEPIDFKDGSSIRLTIARYHTPSGRCIQRNYKSNIQNYYTDLFFRNDSLDSIEVKTAPKFKTKKGRTVLGNGGISPDIKVNVNNKNIPDFFFKLLEQSTIYQFAFTYSDNHRNEFRKFKTWKELDNYLISSSLYNDFIQYCEKQGFKPNEEDKIKAKNIILNHLRAYIVRNIFNDEGFYTIILEHDETFQKASEMLKK
ncbi:MAG: S41 family peptidase [Bacteroidales bacterium]|jgi:carboxyl-terminal processing protease|nr:S41 family peptidase [Bacteroidales bacterium]